MYGKLRDCINDPLCRARDLSTFTDVQLLVKTGAGNHNRKFCDLIREVLLDIRFVDEFVTSESFIKMNSTILHSLMLH